MVIDPTHCNTDCNIDVILLKSQALQHKYKNANLCTPGNIHLKCDIRCPLDNSKDIYGLVESACLPLFQYLITCTVSAVYFC